MITKKDIQEWFENGVERGSKWMLVVCDSFSHESYPAFADTIEEFDEIYERCNGVNMQRIMEIYNLSGNMESQLSEYRVKAIPSASKFYIRLI